MPKSASKGLQKGKKLWKNAFIPPSTILLAIFLLITNRMKNESFDTMGYQSHPKYQISLPFPKSVSHRNSKCLQYR